MLQPALAEAGFSGLFSPVAVAGRGPCEAECNACGHVCPSGAIRPLPLQEKMWAKMGTAVITPGKCLAWEFDRSCLICDEACPYGAIELQQSPEHEVAVPVVLENRCTGCGACEHACPVRAIPAVRITPMAELRLAAGSYRREGKQRGLAISRGPAKEGGKAQERQKGEGKSQLPPGFSE
jgi:formate hydrogenlyase subunit 6/NADH:ubiquinone oxidoreductase subunit I